MAKQWDYLYDSYSHKTIYSYLLLVAPILALWTSLHFIHCHQKYVILVLLNRQRCCLWWSIYTIWYISMMIDHFFWSWKVHVQCRHEKVTPDIGWSNTNGSLVCVKKTIKDSRRFSSYKATNINLSNIKGKLKLPADIAVKMLIIILRWSEGELWHQKQLSQLASLHVAPTAYTCL